MARLNGKDAGWRSKLKIHPAALLFPALSKEERRELEASIKNHQLQNKIKIWRDLDAGEDWLLDGVNRLDALEHLGMPLFDKDGEPDPFYFDMDATPVGVRANIKEELAHRILAANILRRHLTPRARADLATKVLATNKDFLATPRMKQIQQISDVAKISSGTASNAITSTLGRAPVAKKALPDGVRKQIADEAGMHEESISQLIHGSRKFNPETVERVRRITADKLADYVTVAKSTKVTKRNNSNLVKILQALRDMKTATLDDAAHATLRKIRTELDRLSPVAIPSMKSKSTKGAVIQ